MAGSIRSGVDSIGGASARYRTRARLTLAAYFLSDACCFVLALVVTVFVRWTDAVYFPYRNTSFSCDDPDLSSTFRLASDAMEQRQSPAEAMRPFGNIQLDEATLLSTVFLVPTSLVFLVELAAVYLSSRPTKSVVLLSGDCQVPHWIRRALRFTVVYVFGVFFVIITCDVAGSLIGQLATNFLDICQPMPSCVGDKQVTREVCTQTSERELWLVSHAFPSLPSAVAMLGGTYTAIYLHCNIPTSTVRVLRPALVLLSLLLASLLPALEVSRRAARAEEAIAGAAFGIITAVYLAIFALEKFHEPLHLEELDDFYKRSLTQKPQLRHFLTEVASQARPVSSASEGRISRRTQSQLYSKY